MQALKQGFAQRLLRRMRAQADRRQGSFWSTALEEGHIWQRRFYDFVVFSEKKRIEKLRYMHHNPVKRGLVLEPGQWDWSSFRHYAEGERGVVLVNELQKAEMKVRGNRLVQSSVVPTLRKSRSVGQPILGGAGKNQR
jgi:hypothetical protein